MRVIILITALHTSNASPHVSSNSTLHVHHSMSYSYSYAYSSPSAEPTTMPITSTVKILNEYAATQLSQSQTSSTRPKVSAPVIEILGGCSIFILIGASVWLGFRVRRTSASKPAVQYGDQESGMLGRLQDTSD